MADIQEQSKSLLGTKMCIHMDGVDEIIAKIGEIGEAFKRLQELINELNNQALTIQVKGPYYTDM